MTTDDGKPRELEPGYDYVTLYVREEGGELLYAVYEADGLEIPVSGDRISVLEASMEGDVDGDVDYREHGSEPTTYVVERREIEYLAVDYDVEGLDRSQGVVSEITLWVRESTGDG